MKFDTKWLRIKTFKGTVALVVSIGAQAGPRLNVSLHRTPQVAQERKDGQT